jgi:hypothetical protein
MKPISVGLYADITYEKPFYIEDDRRHMVVVGVTGTGKTTTFGNIFRQRINQGWGGTLIDPHGGLADVAIENVPLEKTNKTYWFAPADEDDHKLADRDMGLNIYDAPGTPEFITDRANKIFDRLFGSGWGPSSATLFRWGSLALFAQEEKPTLLKLQMFYYNKDYRKKCLEKVTDRRIHLFFKKYDFEWNANLREDRTAPPLNKLDSLLSNPILLKLFSQPKTSIPFERILDTGGILIVKIPNGPMTEEGSALVGSIVSNGMFQATLARQKKKGKLPRHIFMIDEYPSFTHGTSIRQFMEQARKYFVYVVLGAQSMEEDPDKSTILGATATKIYLRVSYDDAERFRKESTTNKPAESFQNIYTYFAYIRTLTVNPNGFEVPTGPDRVQLYDTLPKTGNEQKRDVVIKKSLEQFGFPRNS